MNVQDEVSSLTNTFSLQASYKSPIHSSPKLTSEPQFLPDPTPRQIQTQPQTLALPRREPELTHTRHLKRPPQDRPPQRESQPLGQAQRRPGSGSGFQFDLVYDDEPADVMLPFGDPFRARVGPLGCKTPSLPLSLSPGAGAYTIGRVWEAVYDLARWRSSNKLRGHLYRDT